MFVLPSQPSFAETFGGHLGTNIVNTATERSELAKRNEEIKKGFAKLGENPSRIELLQAIESLNVPESTKERLYRGFGDAEKEKLTREKTAKELEKSEKEQIRAKNIAQSYGIPEEEARGLIENGATASDLAALGRHRSKSEPGGIRAKPIPPEIQKKIEQVRSENPDATSQQFLAASDKLGIPRSWSEPEAKILGERDAIKAQDPYQKAAQAQQAKANVSLSDELVRVGDKAKKNLIAIEGMRKNIGSTGFNLKNKFADLTGQTAWRDPKSEEFKTYTKQFLSNAADIVRGKVSNYEFQTISDIYAQVDKSPEANAAILDWQEYLEKVDQVKSKEASKILKENRGIPPSDFKQQLDERTDGSIEKLTEEWRRKKDKSVSKIFKRKVVQKGTPLTKDTIKLYSHKAIDQNPNASEDELLNIAEKMAREDGYEF